MIGGAIRLLVFFALSAFALGWVMSTAVSEISLDSPFSTKSNEIASPSDWVKESQILVYKDRVIIDIPNVEWATFTDTNSMDPIIDKDSNALQLVPQNNNQIQIGDIISYESSFVDGIVIHRVIETGIDNEGWYAVAKGDNNPSADPENIRFSQIKRVLIGIIY